MSDEYLRAIALMQAAQLEYLHIIAWAHRNGSTNGETVARTATRVAKQLNEQCPNVMKEIARLPGGTS